MAKGGAIQAREFIGFGNNSYGEHNMTLTLGRKALAGAALLGAATFGLSSAHAQDEKTIKVNLQNAYPATLALLGPAMSQFEADVELLSGGTVDITVHEPSALVPTLEMIDAVSAGSLDMAFGGSVWWGNKEKAFNFFTAVPFGPNAAEFYAWLFNGGGIEINDELYAKYNVKAIFCHILPPEGGGWYNKEINSLDDFKGLRVRWAGFGADVLQRIGASPQLVAPADIQPAMERKTLDGAEFSVPSLDLGFKMYEVASHVYYPGWHQQHGFNQVLINLDTWNSMSARQQRAIQTTCDAMLTRSLAEAEATQPPALHEFKAKGVNVNRFSDQVLDGLRGEWLAIVEELSGSDANFKRTWDSLSNFREQYKLWKEVGYYN